MIIVSEPPAEAARRATLGLARHGGARSGAVPNGYLNRPCADAVNSVCAVQRSGVGDDRAALTVRSSGKMVADLMGWSQLSMTPRTRRLAPHLLDRYGVKPGTFRNRGYPREGLPDHRTARAGCRPPSPTPSTHPLSHPGSPPSTPIPAITPLPRTLSTAPSPRPLNRPRSRSCWLTTGTRSFGHRDRPCSPQSRQPHCGPGRRSPPRWINFHAPTAVPASPRLLISP